MELSHIIEQKPGRTRVLHPLADPAKIHEDFLDPDFWVEMREEASRESARRWDEVKWDPSNKKDPHYNEKAMKAAEKSADSIVNISTMTLDGVELDLPAKRKALFTHSVLTVDDEQKSLWVLCQEEFEEQKKADAKNARRSQPTSTASS